MLETYENIKRLRKLNKWTQEELAARMGYSDRSAIAKIETGNVDIPQSKIIEFAKVFGVEPGDLMGSDGITPEEFSPEDRELLNRYHNASPEDRAIVDLALKRNQQKP